MANNILKRPAVDFEEPPAKRQKTDHISTTASDERSPAPSAKVICVPTKLVEIVRVSNVADLLYSILQCPVVRSEFDDNEYADEILSELRGKETTRKVFQFQSPQAHWRSTFVHFIQDFAKIHAFSRQTLHLGLFNSSGTREIAIAITNPVYYCLLGSHLHTGYVYGQLYN